eukprot:2346607-Prymnesium_polylepis.1
MLRDCALCAETVYLLNDALCDFYSRQCPADTKRYGAWQQHIMREECPSYGKRPPLFVAGRSSARRTPTTDRSRHASTPRSQDLRHTASN